MFWYVKCLSLLSVLWLLTKYRRLFVWTDVVVCLIKQGSQLLCHDVDKCLCVSLLNQTVRKHPVNYKIQTLKHHPSHDQRTSCEYIKCKLYIIIHIFIYHAIFTLLHFQTVSPHLEFAQAQLKDFTLSNYNSCLKIVLTFIITQKFAHWKGQK